MPAKSPLLGSYTNSYPDTSVTQLPLIADRNFGGNIGLPSAPYFFSRQTDEAGFIFFRPYFNSDRISENDVRYYRTTGPFAELSGIAGTAKFQMFRMLFTHTPGNKANITLRLNQSTSDGFYKRQQGRMSNLYLSSNYESDNKRIGYFFYVLHNGIYNAENGGLRDTFLTEQTALQTKSLLPVRITSANRNNKQTKVEFNPYLRLNRRMDSTTKVNHFLSLQSSFEGSSFRYTDKASATDGFYNNFYSDSLQTKDSASLRQFRNGITYHLKDGKGGKGFEISYRNEVSQLWQMTDQVMINNSVQAKAFLKQGLKDSLRFLFLNAQAWQVLNGYNKGDVCMQASAELLLDPKKNTRLNFAAGFQNRRPDQQFLHWQSNHFYWQENFSQQQKTEVELAFIWRRFFRIGLLRQHINHLLYFNEQVLPEQLKGLAKNTSATISIDKVFFRHLGVFAEYRLQSSSAAPVLRFPGSVTTARLFYAGNLSKNKLQLNLGAQLQLYQSFTPYAYMPATQVFYLQSKVETGTFPYVDLYLSGRIRPVSFFVKAENVLANLTGTNYFLQLGYYQPATAVRLGISWMFFD